MAATANERIRDALVAHQVDVLRFSRGLSTRLVKLLDEFEPELRQTIKRRLENKRLLGGDPGAETTKRLERIAATYERILRPTWEKIRDTTRTELLQLAHLESAFVAGTAGATLPVIVNFKVPTLDEIKTIVTQTPIQGEHLQGWLEKWRANDRNRAIQQIRIGLLQNETPVEISRRIFGTVSRQGVDGVRNVTRRGALTLAQTAASMVTNEVKRVVYEKNADVIDQELYVATLDSRTTPICRSLDGKQFPVGDGPRPPVHVNCRSVRVPAFDPDELADRPANAVTKKALAGLKGAERQARVRELVGRVPGKTTYQEFLRNQDAAFQNEVLGRTRAKLFRQGEVDLDAFVDYTGRQYTIDELRDRIPAAFRKAKI